MFVDWHWTLVNVNTFKDLLDTILKYTTSGFCAIHSEKQHKPLVQYESKTEI